MPLCSRPSVTKALSHGPAARWPGSRRSALRLPPYVFLLKDGGGGHRAATYHLKGSPVREPGPTKPRTHGTRLEQPEHHAALRQTARSPPLAPRTCCGSILFKEWLSTPSSHDDPGIALQRYPVVAVFKSLITPVTRRCVPFKYTVCNLASLPTRGGSHVHVYICIYTLWGT